MDGWITDIMMQIAHSKPESL